MANRERDNQGLPSNGQESRIVHPLSSFFATESPFSPNGAFRDNVKIYLQQFGQRMDHTVDGMIVWVTFFQMEDKDGSTFPLYTLKESVKNPERSNCKDCFTFGWGDQFVSKRDYHFIIPKEKDWGKKIGEGDLSISNHILRALIHSNGLGHLIALNGVALLKSKRMCGREAMDFWDRLSSKLKCKKMSVDDSSRKGVISLGKPFMELRLLHAVAYGHTWFGNWNYHFSKEANTVPSFRYEDSLRFVRNIQIRDILAQSNLPSNMKGKRKKSSEKFKETYGHYKKMTPNTWLSIGELLRFLLELTQKETGQTWFTRHASDKRDNTYVDLEYFYKVFFDLKGSDAYLMNKSNSCIHSIDAVETILSVKKFVKEWSQNDDNFLEIRFRALPDEDNKKKPWSMEEKSECDIVVVPRDATVRQLKTAAQTALKELYFVTEDLVVKEISVIEVKEINGEEVEEFIKMKDDENVEENHRLGADFIIRCVD